MDKDTSELIVQLCTRIGMIMEDGSAVALTIAGLDNAERQFALAEIADAAARVSALMKAVKVLAR